MTKLVIVDQSLRDLNGHHYEYDVTVAQAARGMGIASLIAAHEDYEELPCTEALAVSPHFKRAWNEVHQDGLARAARQVLSPLPAALRSSIVSVGSRLRRTLQGPSNMRAASRALPSFGVELAILIQAEQLAAADHVLIHTLSVAELHSLVATLAHRDCLPMFHIVLRRDAEEPAVQSDPWGGISAVFALVRGDACLKGSIQFYSDSTHLCRQYEAFSGGIPVTLLPIPHGLPLSLPPAKNLPGVPACATYLGNARTEKGFHFLPRAVDALRGTHIETARLRFVIQANANLSLEEPVIARARRKLAVYGSDKVELINHPLSIPQFQERLLEADLIVLPYDAEHYRRRSSGILVQALICGRPVVVPSGTWLSDYAPPEAAVVFDGPDDLPNAIAAAVDRLPDLSAGAVAIAPKWRELHNAETLVKRLVSTA